MDFTLVMLFWLGFLVPVLLTLGIVPALYFFAETTSTELVDEVYAVLGRYGRMSLSQITQKVKEDSAGRVAAPVLEVHNALFKLMTDGLVIPIQDGEVLDVISISKLFNNKIEILYEQSGGTRQRNYSFSPSPV